MKTFSNKEVWFITGSQHLYGAEALTQVAEHSREIAEGLNGEGAIPVNVVCKETVKTAEEILNICIDANARPDCVGLICWMHTFSPAKMWIAGLSRLQKPFMHLHTQYNAKLPWNSIDMDFMNLNQSAHGGREFGFIGTRMGKDRKVVVGHWRDEKVIRQAGDWVRAACACDEWKKLKIARFGDNMRQVAVTEGDKVAAQVQFGFTVNGYGVGDLVDAIRSVDQYKVDALVECYRDEYRIPAGISMDALRDEARTETGMRAFLEQGGYKAFTNTFEDLHGMNRLPGLATQRLMADGYGYGAEGDWKTAALLRAMKVMGAGLKGGTSFMEDYTYHFDGENSKVLGAHMLEVCPSISSERPSLSVQPLGIGGKQDPVRLVFDTPEGPSINATVIDLGNRFRMLVNKVETLSPDEELPNLPVARAVWKPFPNLETAAAAWILAGGTHHTAFSQSLTEENLQDFAEMLGVELVLIDERTDVRNLKNELRWNDLYFGGQGHRC